MSNFPPPLPLPWRPNYDSKRNRSQGARHLRRVGCHLQILLFVCAFVFGVLGYGTLNSWWHSGPPRHAGLLLGGLSYLGGATFAATLGNWWPLPIALAVGWGLRLLGLDPGAPKAAKDFTPATNLMTEAFNLTVDLLREKGITDPKAAKFEIVMGGMGESACYLLHLTDRSLTHLPQSEHTKRMDSLVSATVAAFAWVVRNLASGKVTEEELAELAHSLIGMYEEAQEEYSKVGDDWFTKVNLAFGRNASRALGGNGADQTVLSASMLGPIAFNKYMVEAQSLFRP